jgi:Tfp pilus assembly protein PilF
MPPHAAIKEAREQAAKALSLDEALPEAHTSLALIYTYYDWNFPKAESEFKRALELKPGYAFGHQWYSRYLMSLGRFRESIGEMQRALDLDPLSISINLEMGLPYFYQRQYDQAITIFNKALEMDSSFSWTHYYVALCYEQKQEYDRAISEYKLIPDNSKKFAWMAYAYGKAGDSANAKKLIAQVEQMAKSQYVSAVDIAIAYLGLNEKDRVFEWLEKAYENRDESLVRIRANPRFDSLSSDARFKDLLHRIGFDATTQ